MFKTLYLFSLLFFLLFLFPLLFQFHCNLLHFLQCTFQILIQFSFHSYLYACMQQSRKLRSLVGKYVSPDDKPNGCRFHRLTKLICMKSSLFDITDICKISHVRKKNTKFLNWWSNTCFVAKKHSPFPCVLEN